MSNRSSSFCFRKSACWHERDPSAAGLGHTMLLGVGFKNCGRSDALGIKEPRAGWSPLLSFSLAKLRNLYIYIYISNMFLITHICHRSTQWIKVCVRSMCDCVIMQIHVCVCIKNNIYIYIYHLYIYIYIYVYIYMYTCACLWHVWKQSHVAIDLQGAGGSCWSSASSPRPSWNARVCRFEVRATWVFKG